MTSAWKPFETAPQKRGQSLLFKITYPDGFKYFVVAAWDGEVCFAAPNNNLVPDSRSVQHGRTVEWCLPVEMQD